MRRLLAGAALAFTPALLPLCAAAAERAAVTLPHLQRTASPARVPARAFLYALQAIDAVQTSAALRLRGRYEQNPSVRPFTRHGAAGIALGFALGDIVRDRLLRGAPDSARESANAVQAISNLDGILTTKHSMHLP